MKLLLDTHIVLALIEQRTSTLPLAVRGLIAAPTAEFHVSVASLWEVAIKSRLGKLVLVTSLDDLPALLASMQVSLLRITEDHVSAAVDPEPATRDPFDRLLLAQCQVEGLRLVTVDRALISHFLAAPTK